MLGTKRMPSSPLHAHPISARAERRLLESERADVERLRVQAAAAAEAAQKERAQCDADTVRLGQLGAEVSRSSPLPPSLSPIPTHL